MRLRTFFASLTVLSIVACARASSAGGDGGDLVARLERGPCRGTCPEYTVDVYADGRVKFDGRRNTRAAGAQERSIAASVAQSLAQSIATSDFARADTAYTYGTAGCGQYYTDLPVTLLAAPVSGKMKSVRHDLGCNGAPAFLKALAARVDSVAGTAAWIGNGGN